jgi:hypothetical protein
MNDFIIITEFRPCTFDNRTFKFVPVLPVILQLSSCKAYMKKLLNVMHFPEQIICNIDCTYINLKSPYITN